MSVKLAVLASGRGSNFSAILHAIEQKSLDGRVALLISDRKSAHALETARDRGVPAHHIPYSTTDREAFERAAGDLIESAKCDLVILAGFMRILTPYFIRRFPDRILNIHPSLLPAFKGLDAQRQALEYGVKIAGCTVHLVNEDMDAGPIIGQVAVPVLDGDDEEALSMRILEQEHQLYPRAIQAYANRLSNPPIPSIPSGDSPA